MSDKTDDDLMALMFGLPFVIVFFGVLGVWWAYCFNFVWAWYMVPVFSLPMLTVPQSYGLFIVAAFLRGSKNKKDQSTKENLFNAIFGPPLLLALAYLGKVIL